MQTAFGQEEGDNSSWQIKGFLDSYHALRINKPNDLMSSRTRLRGELGKSFANSMFFLSFNATYNALLKERSGFELREAYIDHRERNWGFRIGRQLIIWGVSDAIRITDLVSPLDMTEFLAQDYDDIRMPVNAIRFFVFNQKMKFELIAVPSFEPYKLATTKPTPWSIIPKDKQENFIWSEEDCLPKLKFSNIEYGGRLSLNLEGLDCSFMALHSWNKMPVISYKQVDKKIIASPNYYRMAILGADISKALGSFVLRGELAFNIDKHFTYKAIPSTIDQRGFNTLNYLLAIDYYAPYEWIIMLQYSAENILNYQKQIAQYPNQALLTLSVSKNFLDNSLQLSSFTYFDINNKGAFSRFASSYAINDYLQVSMGCDLFIANAGIFALYKNNSELWLKAKYSF